MAEVFASIKVQGLEELDAALRDLPDEVSGPIMQSALLAGGEVIRKAAAANIHSRTGRTAADIRVAVQVQAERAEGAAAIGGTVKGKTGRAHILRWLEFGAKPHKIVAGKKSRRQARKAARVLARLDVAAALAFAKGISSGRFTHAKALKLPGGIGPKASANHPGIAPQSPLTRALADQGERSIRIFIDVLWSGISAAARRLAKRAA